MLTIPNARVIIIIVAGGSGGKGNLKRRSYVVIGLIEPHTLTGKNRVATSNNLLLVMSLEGVVIIINVSLLVC